MHIDRTRALQALLDAWSEPALLIDDQRVLRAANRAFARSLGAELEELLGEPVFARLPERFREHARRVDAAFGGERVVFEEVVDGRRLLHQLDPVLDVGRVVGVALFVTDVTAVATAPDVTQARVLERKVQHTQKLESLGVLAGGIAHDFNNVLAGILGNVGLAQNELPPDSRAGFFLREAELAAQRAADLTRQMLAYSGRGAFVVDIIDLNATIHEVQSLLATVVSKKASLKIALGKNLPLVRGDATQIRQVLMNLVMNASDALEGGPGSIRISTSLTEATAADLARSYLDDALEPGPYLAIEVSDTGAGMSREVLGRIFEPFFSTKAAGHGLGLAAVLGILRAHGAAVIVDSEPGRGTTFEILLPAALGATLRVRSEPPRAKPAARAHARVLVADDEEAVLTVTCKTLERLGYECVRCSNGAEALARLSEGEPEVDIAILDLTMPELGGGEVLTELRRRGGTTPVILMSGFGASDTSPELMSAGPIDFIEKPFVPGELSRRIQRIIGSKK